MDLKESIKYEVCGDYFVNARNCSVQAEDEVNTFEFVYTPLASVLTQFQDKQILCDGQMIHKDEDKISDFEKEKSFKYTIEDQTPLSVMSHHNEADNDALRFCYNAPLSIDKPYKCNVQNPGVCIPNVKEEIIETGSKMSWPKETSGCSETPCSRSKDNISLVNDTMQPENEVIEHDGDGVVFEIQGVPVDQSFNDLDESCRFNQLRNTVDQSQSGSCCKCEKCDQLFTNKGAFRRHIKAKHPDRSVVKRYKCELCFYSSDYTAALKNHQNVHTKNKPFQCTLCSKKFTQNSTLITHFRIHTKERPYECNKCGKKFQTSSSMLTHIRTVHDKIKSYVCNVCGFTFALTGNLKTHMLTHTGVRNYKCQYCDKRFARSENMRIHERIHTGEKPHKCKKCSAAFTDLTKLRNHVIVRHTKKYPYKCSICDKGLLVPSEVKKHENRCCKT